MPNSGNTNRNICFPSAIEENSQSELKKISREGGSINPLLEKGDEGGLEKPNIERRDMELLTIYKISPDPSLPKRGKKLVSS